MNNKKVIASLFSGLILSGGAFLLVEQVSFLWATIALTFGIVVFTVLLYKSHGIKHVFGKLFMGIFLEMIILPIYAVFMFSYEISNNNLSKNTAQEGLIFLGIIVFVEIIFAIVMLLVAVSLLRSGDFDRLSK